jgi:hypothetical protein
MSHALTPEEALLCLAARTQVDAPLRDRINQALRGHFDAEALWTLGQRHEVLPLVWRTLSDPASIELVEPGLATRLKRRYYATLIRNEARVAELVRILDALDAAGVEAMPVKGPSLAMLAYGHPALRTFDDLDILVRRDDVDVSRPILRSLGYATNQVPTFSEAHHAFHDLQWFGTLDGGLLCVELHWALWSPAFFGGDVAELWARSRLVLLRDRPTPMLSTEDTLLHLAIHRTSSPLRLRFVCDVAEIVRRNPDLDWEATVQRATAYGARTALFAALDLAARLLDAPVPPAVLQRLRIGAAKRAVLERTCGVSALFRRVADDEMKQQPRLLYRVVEQDGPMHIARSALGKLLRKPAKWRYAQRTLRPD